MLSFFLVFKGFNYNQNINIRHKPTKIKNSPIKLLVPGKLIFAIVKNKKIII